MCKLLTNAGKPQQQQQQHRIAYKKLKLSQMVQEGTRYVYAACASLLFWPIGHPSSAVVVFVIGLAATVANTLYVHNNNKQRSLTLAYKEIKYLRPRILSAIVTQTNQTKLNSLSFQSHTHTQTPTLTQCVCVCVCAF